jgi:hypothetical protein
MGEASLRPRLLLVESLPVNKHMLSRNIPMMKGILEELLISRQIKIVNCGRRKLWKVL